MIICVVCGKTICPRNSQKYADRIFTRFKWIILIILMPAVTSGSVLVARYS